MNNICYHGVRLNELNCLICKLNARNVCKCNNGTCELCKIYIPLTTQINNCLKNICVKDGIDTNILKL